MRKLIVANFMSLDGYFEGPDKDVMALPFDPMFDEYNLERVRTADTLLLGASSYPQMMAFWPRLADDPDASPTEQEIARFQRDATKVVISDSLTDADTAAYPATVVRRADAIGHVRDLKEQDGRDILIFASHTTWNPLLHEGLVDELHLMVGSAAIGGGTPLFTGPTPRLRLLDVRTYEGFDNPVLQYACR